MSELANTHILWAVSEDVETLLEESPSIIDASVYIGWPARVVVLIEERMPEMIWRQDDQSFWVDPNGVLMPARAELEDLLTIFNEGDSIPFYCPGASCPIDDPNFLSLDPLLINGARVINAMRPDLAEIAFHGDIGLHFSDPRGWNAIFGTGEDIERKMRVYESLIVSLTDNSIIPSEIDVSNPDAPVYSR